MNQPQIESNQKSDEKKKRFAWPLVKFDFDF